MQVLATYRISIIDQKLDLSRTKVAHTNALDFVRHLPVDAGTRRADKNSEVHHGVHRTLHSLEY